MIKRQVILRTQHGEYDCGFDICGEYTWMQVWKMVKVWYWPRPVWRMVHESKAYWSRDVANASERDLQAAFRRLVRNYEEPKP